MNGRSSDATAPGVHAERNRGDRGGFRLLPRFVNRCQYFESSRLRARSPGCLSTSGLNLTANGGRCRFAPLRRPLGPGSGCCEFLRCVLPTLLGGSDGARRGHWRPMCRLQALGGGWSCQAAAWQRGARRGVYGQRRTPRSGRCCAAGLGAAGHATRRWHAELPCRPDADVRLRRCCPSGRRTGERRADLGHLRHLEAGPRFRSPAQDLLGRRLRRRPTRKR